VAVIDVKELKNALVAAGFEVFRVREEEVHLAERQNVHLMEAGVRARGGAAPMVTIVARAQRNDAPMMSELALLDAVRSKMSALVDAGFIERDAGAREIRSVSDPAHVLDVWYEVTLERVVEAVDDAVHTVGIAMRTERYIVPRG